MTNFAQLNSLDFNSTAFFKWISSDLVNLANHDKIPDWFGYQGYYLSGNNYVGSSSIRKNISITTRL